MSRRRHDRAAQLLHALGLNDLGVAYPVGQQARVGGERARVSAHQHGVVVMSGRHLREVRLELRARLNA